MYTVEISIDHSNFPDYMHFTLLKVDLGVIITYCVRKGINVKELSFENKLVKKMKEIKGTYRDKECFEYKVHGKIHWIKNIG